jgi:tetratricopeptide (TPR) repeat protein
MNKYFTYILIIIFFVFNGKHIMAQKSKKDSLLTLLSASIEDTNKVNTYIALSNQYDYFNSKERIENYISALNLSKKLNHKNGIVKVSSILITNLSHRQLFDVALEYCNNYIDYLKTNGLNEELKKNYKLYATLLSRQGKYAESLQYNYKALNYYLSKNDENQYATVLSNICLLHLNNKQADSAYFYGLRAIDIFRKNNKQSELANSISALAEISFSKKDFVTARVKALQSLEIYTNAKVELGILNVNCLIGNIDLEEQKYDSAIVRYNIALDLLKKFSLPEIKRDCYLSLSKCYSGLKKGDLAYTNHILFSAYNDSVSDQRLKAKTLEMDAKYSITKKEGELREKELKIISQGKQRNFLILGLVGILILFILSYRGYQQKKKANHIIMEQKKLVEEKQKEIIDSIRYAKRIQQSLLPTEKYIERHIKK